MTISAPSSKPQPIRLRDYAPFPFLVKSVQLQFELDRKATVVESHLLLERKFGGVVPLQLDGVGLSLDAIALDGEPLPPTQYRVEGDVLSVFDLPPRCTLMTRTTISPAANEGDEGLFELSGKLATQCEAEGLRRITWFPDRPDVLAVYSVTLIGDSAAYPVMLGNGHPVAEGALVDGRRWVRWEDPFPKPSYIFAIVAGDFACLSDEYITGSGRRIELGIYADRERIGECDFAMGALKRSLRWEEDKYGREYDLDVYNIVALTGHVGAMENKGLNIFDANGICADPDISTDADYLIIERILAHEVFHNWTGNRVTCRDWFQLCLKEGLTRYRDQCFSQDMSGAGVKRIEFVKALQRNQFPEDDGPAAHAVKPDEYIEIRNFYTATVYEKGAEVIRMLQCLIGDELFRQGVQLYLERYDLQAVTTEDFIAAIQDASGYDLSQFYRWYEQAGRPQVVASGSYDAATRCYELRLSQSTPATPGQPAKQPFHIPVLAGLLDQSGDELSVHHPDIRMVDGNLLLELRQESRTFRFENMPSEPVPSLLRGFSAPVSLQADLSNEQLAFLWSRDTDSYNRWQAGQSLAINVTRELARHWHAKTPLELDQGFSDAWSALLGDEKTEPGLLAELLALPEEPALSAGLARIDIDGHYAARAYIARQLTANNRQRLLERYHALAVAGPYVFSAEAIGQRSLRNRCLELLLADPDKEVLALCLAQIRSSENMTDGFAALAALCHVDCPERAEGLADFYQRWQHKPPVIDKWFNAQALSRLPNAVDLVLELEQHPAMDIMNAPRAMAFYGGFFRQNRVGFNEPGGRAYDMLAERLILVDGVKPGSTYWLMPQILQWRRFDHGRQELMRAALRKVRDAKISKGLYEIVSKALAGETP
ncbi:MAG: aminopeptidase N [Haliea sp.]|uniref:aminopeptidase N n=1 Tax=Haliea sp. TaxID=1932666 RepID=UPI0032ED7068